MGRRRKRDIGEYCVYLHIIPKSVTGYKYKKYYVGITKDINRRWAYNGEQYKGQIFYNAIQKYGWNNIKHKILYTNLSKEKAMELEKKMIVKYRSKIDDMGYNVSDGGEYISEKRCDFHAIYCIDTQMFFRTAKIASQYNGEFETTIRNKCRYHKNSNTNVRTGYRYCYCEEAYKYMDYVKKGDKILVDIDSKECNGVRWFNKKYNKRITHRKIIDIYMYYHYLEKDWIGKKSHKAFLSLNDYLYLFDCIEVSDF